MDLETWLKELARKSCEAEHNKNQAVQIKQCCTQIFDLVAHAEMLCGTLTTKELQDECWEFVKQARCIV